jgi:YidC/Oxa1 family membrane protein insertase
VFDFLYTAVSWVLLRWHELFSWMGLDPAGGVNWALSIIFLVVTARLLLFRLFVKQVKYQRNMQRIQPQLQKIREKYKNDRPAMQREMMALQQKEGFNPLAGCLPMLLQIPIFISLFHVLRHVSNSARLCDSNSPADQSNPLLTLYSFTHEQTCNAAQAKLFGAPLAGSLRDSTYKIVNVLGGDVTSTRVVTIVLVLISAAATLVTQLLVAHAATTVPTGTAATVQKLMKVFIPISVLFSGVFFPLGVLLYWFTSNVWTMLQQLYINKFHPPEEKEETPTGQLGKTLAPKPGQRPVRDNRGRTVLAKPSDPSDDPDEAADDSSFASSDKTKKTEKTNKSGTGDGADTSPPRSTAPRPGQRPQRSQRQGGSRPPSKRPSQAKKRR